MRVVRSGLDVEVWAPAKLNLFLNVLEKREDGYHEIETLMCCVDLYDTLYFRDDREGKLAVSYEFGKGFRDAHAPADLDFPEGTDNLVVQAVDLFRQRAGIRAGAKLHLMKRIPIAAGLGGGSSDAAAALVAANEAWQVGMPPGELTRLAAQLGSDVPFFLSRRPAIARGRGERIEPVDQLGPLHFVLVRPPVGLSTRAVYEVCRPNRAGGEVAPLVAALQRGNVHRAGRLMHNTLQAAAEALTPWIGQLRNVFAKLDILGHQMTGSGTCYFGLCRHARHAQRVAANLQGRGMGQVYAVRSCP